MSTPYRVLELEQKTPEWFKARHRKMTASREPVLFDASPHQTRLQLFEEMSLDEPKPEEDKEVFRMGHAAEAQGREWIKANLGLEMRPMVLVSNECPDLLASLDGFDLKRNAIFEAKFTGAAKLADIKSGKIPEHFAIQIQTQLFVSGAKFCTLFALDPKGEAAVIDIEPDTNRFAAIIEKTQEFMKALREGKAPEPSDRDWLVVNDQRLERLAGLKREADDAAEAYESYRTEVCAEFTHPRVKGGGLTLVRSIVKGNVDYDRLLGSIGFAGDKDIFRKKASSRLTVSFEKKGKKS